MSLLHDFQNCSTNFEAWFYAFVFFVGGYITFLFIDLILNKNDNYRQGQIDALNGKIKYKKTVNKDGETVWIEIIDQTHKKSTL
jgi:hypothetical protein